MTRTEKLELVRSCLTAHAALRTESTPEEYVALRLSCREPEAKRLIRAATAPPPPPSDEDPAITDMVNTLANLASAMDTQNRKTGQQRFAGLHDQIREGRELLDRMEQRLGG